MCLYFAGLTRTKIIFGCDDFDSIDLDEYYYKGLDPEIETFQLVSLMPLQFIKLNFCRKRGREMMRICICGEEEKPMLFEFGGHLYKSVSRFRIFCNNKQWLRRHVTIWLILKKIVVVFTRSYQPSRDTINQMLKKSLKVTFIGVHKNFSPFLDQWWWNNIYYCPIEKICSLEMRVLIVILIHFWIQVDNISAKLVFQTSNIWDCDKTGYRKKIETNFIAIKRKTI